MFQHTVIKKNKFIGIWGFGIVGKAAVHYFHAQGYQLGVMDKRQLTSQELDYLKARNITWYSQEQQELFLNFYEVIIFSPGVNVSQLCYATHKNKWLHELDFFYSIFNKPIIAITGSIGKTSTTHLLSQICKEASIPVALGGNIGIPTFDLINQKDIVNYALLEVSSFQLNYCKSFAPFLAIITNFYPNHLDHHANEQEYFLAKDNILRQQTKDQLSLIPFILRNKVSPALDEHKRSYFITSCPEMKELSNLKNTEQIYYINENKVVMRYSQYQHIPIMTISTALLNLSFIDNILLLAAVCDLLKINTKLFKTIAPSLQLPEHRIEKIGSINSIDFYNDSKATTTASTLAAVKKLHNRPLHLFLGGLSKGVDRAPFIAQLKNHVKHIYCFGKEAIMLYTMCLNNNISATYFSTLADAVNACVAAIHPGDCVLLSPAGSSFDLYENYEQRGKHFKDLINHYIQKI